MDELRRRFSAVDESIVADVYSQADRDLEQADKKLREIFFSGGRERVEIQRCQGNDDPDNAIANAIRRNSILADELACNRIKTQADLLSASSSGRMLRIACAEEDTDDDRCDEDDESIGYGELDASGADIDQLRSAMMSPIQHVPQQSSARSSLHDEGDAAVEDRQSTDSIKRSKERETISIIETGLATHPRGLNRLQKTSMTFECGDDLESVIVEFASDDNSTNTNDNKNNINTINVYAAVHKKKKKNNSRHRINFARQKCLFGEEEEEETNKDDEEEREEFRTARAGDEISSPWANSGETPSPNPLRDFERIARLGRGGFGSVYKAKNKITGETVAIKISQHASPSMKEIDFLQKCDCPNIVTYYGAYQNADPTPTMWIVLEYCGGGSVEDLLETEGTLDDAQIATVMRGVLRAVQYLHENSILHRDIKPGNILLTSRGEPKLADLGCSRDLGPDDLAHTVMGTYIFMAPEFFTPHVGYTQKADIWSIGVTVLQMACGEELWLETMKQLRTFVHPGCSTSYVIPVLRRALGDRSDSLKNFVYSCMHPDAWQRPTAEELLTHPFIRNFAKGPEIMEPICRLKEEKVLNEKVEIEPLIKLGNLYESQMNEPLKEGILNACVDIVETVKKYRDKIEKNKQARQQQPPEDRETKEVERVDDETSQETDDMDETERLIASLEKIGLSVDLSQLRLFDDLRSILDSKTPRVLVVGRTGSGKSALINALLNEYVAPLSAAMRCATKRVKAYKRKSVQGDLTFVDSPGCDEVVDKPSHSPSVSTAPAGSPKTIPRNRTAKETILDESFVLIEKNALTLIEESLEKSAPDIVFFLIRAKDLRYGVQQDLDFLKEVLLSVYNRTGARPLVVGVCAQVDELDPSDELLPAKWGKEKIGIIEQVRGEFDSLLRQFFEGFPYDDAEQNVRPSRSRNSAGLPATKTAKGNTDDRYTVRTFAVSCKMVWNEDKSKYRDYRHNVDSLLAYLRSDQVLSRLATVRMQNKEKQEGVFVKRWVRYAKDTLQSVRAKGCGVKEFSELSERLLFALAHLVSAVNDCGTEVFKIFWKHFMLQSNLSWDKKRVGVVLVQGWLMRSSAVDILDVCDWLIADCAARFFGLQSAKRGDAESSEKDAQKLAKRFRQQLWGNTRR